MFSMFHRRLALLLLLALTVFGALAARLAELTVVKGDELRAEAERALVTERWTPTQRGRILDAKGRVLAHDLASFDIAVDYDVISGEWARKQAARAARIADRAGWAEAEKAERERRIDAATPAFEDRLRRFWADFAQIAGVPQEELERRRAEILRAVQNRASSVWERERERREAELRQKTGKDVRVTLGQVARPLREQRTPHVLVHGVTDEQAFAFRRLGSGEPGDPAPTVRVIDASRREYPFESMSVGVDRSTFPSPLRLETVQETFVTGVASHILGWMRTRVFREDEDRRREASESDDPATLERGRYLEGDAVGQAGAEEGYERSLRGMRGRTVTHLDTGLREETPAVPGSDLRLTIDVALQARVQAVMSPDLGLARVAEWHKGSLLPVGTPLNGAAVVLDIETGNVLAMVSTPTFTRDQLRDDPGSVFRDRVDHPWVNRAIGAPYPPGSIVKALLLAGAATSGAHRLERTIECTGHLFPDRSDMFRCWIFKQFHTTHSAQLGHALNAPEAMMVSCNIFFYNVARELGPAGVAEWYRRFGVGTPWNLGIGPEAAGTLGTGPRGEISKGDAIHMGIGQGPVSWTPLHAADAYATLARGGLRITPRLNADAEARAQDLRLDPAAVAAVTEGLRMSVNERRGTGHHLQIGERIEEIFNASGVDVWGKTGTAEAPDIAIDTEVAGARQREIVREGDHSWFVVVVGPAGQRPRYAVSVMMEYAGSGGRVSGPICNQIIHALIAEGYLPRATGGASGSTATVTGGRG